MIFDGQHIEAIIFDLGGVILNIDYQLPIKAFQKLGLGDFEDRYNQMRQSTLFDDFETGRIPSEKFLEEMAKAVKAGTPVEKIQEAWNAILLDLPEERLFILEKAAENHRTFLLSNTNSIHINAFNNYLLHEHQLPSLEPFFEKVYLSWEIGMRKPDAEIFEYVIKDAGLDPEKTLFIDDSLQHILTAKELGFVTHHLKNETIIELLEHKI